MNLIDTVNIEIEIGTLATLIAGLYCTFSVVDPIAIPTSVYIELCEKLLPFLDEWDYEMISFEDWIKTCLIIAPYELFTEDEISEFKKNDIYFERLNGRALLICTAEVYKNG